MKKTTFTLFLALVLSCFASGFAQVSGIECVEFKKEQLVDYDHNGDYDYLKFKVKTKFGQVSVPVVSISIVLQDGSMISNLPFYNRKLKRTMNKYQVDLRGRGISGEFTLFVKFDVSGIPGMEDGGYIIDGGPGGTLNETILIIKYP